MTHKINIFQAISVTCPKCHNGMMDCPNCSGMGCEDCEDGRIPCDVASCDEGIVELAGSVGWEITLRNGEDFNLSAIIAADNGWVLHKHEGAIYLVEIGTGQDSSWELAYLYATLGERIPGVGSAVPYDIALRLTRGGAVHVTEDVRRIVSNAAVVALEAMAAECYDTATNIEHWGDLAPAPSEEDYERAGTDD